MLGVLLEENDADVRPSAPQYTLPGEYTEMEISRVALQANVSHSGQGMGKNADSKGYTRSWNSRACDFWCERLPQTG